MIVFNDLSISTQVSFSEEGDVLILENDYIFGVKRILSFVDEIESEDIGVFFQKFFQYTVDGVHWSEWVELTNFNLSNVNTKYNQVFGIRYKYIRLGQNSSLLLYFSSISLNIEYQQPLVPNLYQNSYFKKYLSFYNKESINWSVNVLGKVYERGIVPRFIERGDNSNWGDEDFINFWWPIIYINALKVSYGNIFNNLLDYTDLLKKFLIQKDLIPGETNDLGQYYYLLTYYYDEIMKRGSVSVFDKERLLPNNFSDVVVRGELLRLCNQPDTVESIFGIIRGEETGWVIGLTCPNYNYNDSYRDFIKGFELSESIEDISKYPLEGSEFISLETIEIEESNIQCFKVNTEDNLVFAGIGEDYSKSILVDQESDYEISFKIKGLVEGNGIKFGVTGYNFLGSEITFLNIEDETENSMFLETDELSGDLFIRGFIRFKSFETLKKLPQLGGLINLKFSNGIERISPVILVSCDNDVYLYDIKIKNLPVSSTHSILLSNSELVLKILSGFTSLSKEEIIKIIEDKLIPIHMIVTTSERDLDSEMLQNRYLPYNLPFDL